jgi:hypothetical protein
MHLPRRLIACTLLALAAATLGACHYDAETGGFVCDNEDYIDLGANPLGGIRFVKWNPLCVGPAQLPAIPEPVPSE